MKATLEAADSGLAPVLKVSDYVLSVSPKSVERCELKLDAFGVESGAEPLEPCSGGEERKAGGVGSTRSKQCVRMQLARPRGFVRRFSIDPALVCELESAGGVARLAVRELGRAAGERGARGECRRRDRGCRLLQLVGRRVKGVDVGLNERD